jgi:hypothetical protein
MTIPSAPAAKSFSVLPDRFQTNTITAMEVTMSERLTSIVFLNNSSLETSSEGEIGV